MHPYVYKATNIDTGEFYIGYRTRHVNLKISIDDDIGKIYTSSSKLVNENLDKFEFKVLVVCQTSEYAYNVEQMLIKQNWNSPKLINQHFVDTSLGFNHFRCLTHNDKTKNKISKALIGIKRSDETIIKFKEAAARRLPAHYRNSRGRPGIRTAEENLKRSLTMKNRDDVGKGNVGKTWWNNGVSSILSTTCPDGFVSGRLSKNNKYYIIETPHGTLVETNNMEKYCKLNDDKLDASSMRNTFKTQRYHKGYRVISINNIEV